MKTIFTEDQVREGVARLAREISAHYAQRPITIIGVLTGSVVLLADLIRQLEMPLRVAFIHASSYRGQTTTRGQLTVNSDDIGDITGRDVLLVDDIYDTGNTLVEILDLLKQLKPSSIHSAVLLRKEGRQEVDVVPDFVAFEIPDEFVVGYGLDYNDAYRNLRWVAALEPEDLAGTAP